jgi:hypothetical protein
MPINANRIAWRRSCREATPKQDFLSKASEFRRAADVLRNAEIRFS